VMAQLKYYVAVRPMFSRFNMEASGCWKPFSEREGGESLTKRLRNRKRWKLIECVKERETERGMLESKTNIITDREMREMGR